MAFHPLVFAALLALNSLARLTVTQLTLSADTTSPKLEVPFNVVVTAHVRERVARLEDVMLPDFEKDLELLGDQRTLISDRSGTTYTETIRMVAHHTGAIVIPPVTLDAIDSRDGKPKRFSSNSLTLNVTGGALEAPVPQFDWLGLLFTALRWLIPIVALILVIRLISRRRTLAASAPEPVVIELPRAVPTREGRLRDALITLRAERSRGTVMRVRHVTREMVGANDDETLADVLAKAKGDESLRALLRALERAAFTYEDDLQPAISAVLVQLEQMTA